MKLKHQKYTFIRFYGDNFINSLIRYITTKNISFQRLNRKKELIFSNNIP
jgi:hypothetical protein